MKMDSTSAIKPKTMAELLPGLSGILSRDAIQTLTVQKQPRKTIAPTRTTEKVLKPLTIAEMRADIKALRIQSPRRGTQVSASNKKKNWNSSVKVDRKISHTANGQLKNNPVRKVLNFQPGSRMVTNSRVTMNKPNLETPKFPKPEFRAKKSLHLQARNVVRISGVCNISETPSSVCKPNKSKLTLANKENLSSNANLIRKSIAPPRVTNCQPLQNPAIPDTPLSNESWKSSCDASFLQNEKEIQDSENERTKAIAEEATLENIAEVTPPVSTPFKDYRINVKEYFNNSSELETSALCQDDTIMCFDNLSVCPEVNKREESVIVSLCDLLNKAKVSNPEKTGSELEDLLKVEQHTEHHIKMLESGIQTLKDIKTSQMKSLQYVRKLISKKRKGKEVHENEHEKTLMSVDNVLPTAIKNEKKTPVNVPIIIKTPPLKTPSYKIPKKNLCLREKVFHKSMPNMHSPSNCDKKALNMYMEIKQRMNFLNTPVVNHTNTVKPDTPAVTSHNLQRQLDKLYGES